MNSYFLCGEDVHHPETGNRILMVGDVYTMSQMHKAAAEYGVDGVKGYIIIAEDFQQAMVTASRIIHA